MSGRRTAALAGIRSAGGQRGMSLVELLVGMAIMGVITAMLLMSWFALSRSYSFSMQSNRARDDARQALSRMAREIRDAENPPAIVSTTEVAIVRARARWIQFYTTFNAADAANPFSTPRLVMYRLYPDGELWRFADVNKNGTILNVAIPGVQDPWQLYTYNVAEQLSGEGAMLMCKNVINNSVPSVSNPTPVFMYSRYLSNGSLQLDPVVYSPDRKEIVAVQIHMLVDINPKRAPTYVDLVTTAQLRNQH